MKRTIALFTTTRAEFGILASFIRKVQEDSSLNSFLFVGGTHLKKEFGHTIDEINNSGFKVTDTFDYLDQIEDSPYNLTKSSGKCMEQLAEIFKKYSFDYTCILGDRYELIPIVQSSILFNVPIIHFGGGEITEGAIDNKIRHMVTQASDIHLTAADTYSQFLVNMGIPKEDICTVGSLAVETMKNVAPIDKESLFKDLNLDLNKETIMMTYHPVTVKGEYTQLQQIENIFKVLLDYDFQIVITAPNLEAEREIIIDYINKQVEQNENMHLFNSLGMKRYHSMISYCSFIIGNSSSGIFEVPFYKKPTVNIGDRQKGRYLHPSIIQTDNSTLSIKQGIEKAKSAEYLSEIKDMKYQFGEGNSSELALQFIKNKLLDLC